MRPYHKSAAVIRMKSEGYKVWKIAQVLGVSEHWVVKVLLSDGGKHLSLCHRHQYKARRDSDGRTALRAREASVRV